MNAQVSQFPIQLPCPTVVRFNRLIELHGSHTSALEALLRDAEILEQLKRAIRAAGLCPEEILRSAARRR
jgi:hypothetical protein